MVQIYLAVYGNDPKSLILLIGWLPAAISIFFVFVIRPMHVQRSNGESRVFYQYLYISVALAVFLMVVSIVQTHVSFSHVGYVASATVISVLLCLPIAIAVKQELVIWNLMKQSSALPVVVSTVDEAPPIEEPKPLAHQPTPDLNDRKNELRVAGKLYDREALKQLSLKGISRSSSVHGLSCIGKQCYRNSFAVMAATSFFGALVSFVLVMRTKKFYEGDVYEKFKSKNMSTNEMETQSN
ncbi:hypothetical protein Sjap_001358 [Stephania japonica]|uniref:Nodulin-like domain-containing protein n=1 Tax=Stephania japonica TaxID=461633 RepID=A0AAP0PRE3_9MAGN